MKDLLLTSDGDLNITSDGDISLTDSVAQAIRIRLLWFYNEWRLGTDFGIPYFEEILIKDPHELRIRQIFRDEILSVNEVTDVTALDIKIKDDRTASITYTAVASGETITDEVVLYG